MKKLVKTYVIFIIAMSMLSFSVLIPPAKAAGAITLTPNANVTAGSTVTVSGTGFGAAMNVGIGLGTTIAASNDNYTTFSGTGTGPYTATLAHYPIVPGSFSMHWDTAGTGSDWTDNGDGTLATSSSYSAGGTVNYATGVFGRSSTMDLSSYALTATCSYTYYQYKVTPTSGVTTNSTGGFTASITVPAVANGVYTVTVVTSNGGTATASLGVGVVLPETLTIGVVVLLSSVAVVAGAVLTRKPKIKILNSAKL